MDADKSRYIQLKLEIEKYKKLKKERGFWFAILLAAIVVFVSTLVDMLLEMAIEKVSVGQWLTTYRWALLPSRMILWTILFYFWGVKNYSRQLNQKTGELHQLLSKNPSLEEAHNLIKNDS